MTAKRKASKTPAKKKSGIRQTSEKTEENLQSSELWLHSIYNSLDEAVLVVTPGRKLVNVNRAAEVMFGYSEEELCSSSTEILHVDHQHYVEFGRRIQDAFADNRTANFEFTAKRKNGEIFPTEHTVSLLKNKNGETLGIVSVVRDISNRKRAEEMLREMHQLLDDVQRLSKLGGWKYDVATGRITWTDEVYRIYGVGKDYDPNDVDKDISFYSPEDMETISHAFKKAVSSGEPYDLELRFVRLNGEHIWVRTIGTPITENGKVVSVTGNIVDITERKQTEERLAESERQLRATSLYTRSLIEASLDPLVTISKDGKITDVNEATESVTGVSRAELIGSDFSDYFTEPEKAREGYRRVFEKGTVKDYPLAIRHKSGHITDVLYNATVYRDPSGKVQGVFAAARDITERKKAEEEVKRSLEEKEVLLKEIHHRVKNNMTIIYTLLEMQARITRDDHDREMLNDAKARIKAMALIHEKLYGSKDLARVDFDDYLRGILHSMFTSYLKDPGRIALKMDVRDIALSIDDAIPCALIINELVSNTLKHAFPEGRKGEVIVNMRSYDTNMVELIIADNGVGLPDDLDSRRKASLGLNLIEALVKQLQGEIELRKEEGTRFGITFRRHK